MCQLHFRCFSITEIETVCMIDVCINIYVDMLCYY